MKGMCINKITGNFNKNGLDLFLYVSSFNMSPFFCLIAQKNLFIRIKPLTRDFFFQIQAL